MSPCMESILGRTAVIALVVAACSNEPAVQRTATDDAETGTTTEAAPAGEPAAVADAETPVVASGAAPPAGTVLQAQEVDATTGLVAEIIEATRKEGVLTVKVRFRNTGSESVYKGFETHHGGYSLFYVTAGNQKFFILKDSEGEPLAPKYLNVSLDPGQAMTWWGKFPAPPPSEATIDLVMPDMPPFEDVPVRDA